MRPTHKQSSLGFETRLILRILVGYGLLFALFVYSVSAFFTLSGYLTAVVVLLWGMTFGLALVIPNERESSVRQGKWFVGGYLALLIIFRFAINYFYSLNPAALGESINPAMAAVTSGSMQLSAVDLLQNVFLISSIATPLSFGLMMWQKIRHHRIKVSSHTAFAQAKGIKKDYNS